MVTTIGSDGAFRSLVENLITLENDTLPGNAATIERLESTTRKTKVIEFQRQRAAPARVG